MTTTSQTAVRSRSAAAIDARVRMRSNEPKPFAIFTAVEGALLEAGTLRAGKNRRLLQEIQAAGVPVVPFTVMTLDEIKPVLRQLGIAGPVIIEAGGGIARRVKSRWSVEPCGLSADVWLDVVREIEDRSGASLLIYSALPESDALRLSARKGEMFRHSMQRRFSEPFVIESGDVDSIREAAAAMGFNLRQGRRLFYLSRHCDEGKAFTRVRAELQCEMAIALGALPLDAEFLRQVEIPIIMPGPDGQPDANLVAEIAGARIAPSPAPGGWEAAVDELWPMLTTARRPKLRA